MDGRDIRKYPVRGTVGAGLSIGLALLRSAAARLLEPERFLGRVAMVTVVTAVLDRFRQPGFRRPRCRHRPCNNEQISTLFWINILVGVMLSILCAHRNAHRCLTRQCPGRIGSNFCPEGLRGRRRRSWVGRPAPASPTTIAPTDPHHEQRIAIGERPARRRGSWQAIDPFKAPL